MQAAHSDVARNLAEATDYQAFEDLGIEMQRVADMIKEGAPFAELCAPFEHPPESDSTTATNASAITAPTASTSGTSQTAQ